MPSIFSKIIAGEIPCYKVKENENYLALLDVFPLVKGHVLIIPKKEVDYIFDLDENTYSSLWSFAKEVSTAIKKAFPCNRIGVAVIGLEVPHAHIHLVPINNMQDINFSNKKLALSKSEFVEVAEKIKSFL